MSGTTQVVLAAAGIGVAGAIVAALITARSQRRNARRAAHAATVGPARLIKREMEQGHVTALDAFEQGLDEVDLPSSEWDQHKQVVASQLTEEELLVLDRYYAAVKLGAVPLVLATNTLALQAITWLAVGKSNVTRPRKTERSLAPVNMDLRCECGHIFGHHGWRAVRRRVRLRHRDAKFKDVGFECKRCNCQKFKGVGRLVYM